MEDEARTGTGAPTEMLRAWNVASRPLGAFEVIYSEKVAVKMVFWGGPLVPGWSEL